MLIVDLGDFDTLYENSGFNSYFTTCYSVRTVLDRRFSGARFFPQVCIPFIGNIRRYDGSIVSVWVAKSMYTENDPTFSVFGRLISATNLTKITKYL